MYELRYQPGPWDEKLRANGLGTCCAESQADGVPCSGPGNDCAACDRAPAIMFLTDFDDAEDLSDECIAPSAMGSWGW